VIRIDVQGLGAAVLQCAAQTIMAHSNLKIIVEVHPQLRPMHGLDETSFKAELRDLGLTAQAPDGGTTAYLHDAHVVLQSAR
jgi:hypothetical protein